MQLVLFGFILLLCLFQTSDARDTYTSALWVEDLYSHVENKTVGVRINGAIGFICPNLPTVVKQRSFDKQVSDMNENLWLVRNETFYENCEIPENSSSRVFHFVCNDANQLSFVNLLFLEYSAGKDDMTFEGGKYYYVFSTSDGTLSSINNRKGGHCLTHNMRVKIYVCKRSSDPHPLCKNIDPKLNIIPPSDPSKNSHSIYSFINPVIPAVPAIITNANNDANTKTPMKVTTEAHITKATEAVTTEANKAVPTGEDDSLEEPVELIWEISHNQTQTTTISKEEHYPVVALCKEPNIKISLLNDKNRILDSWLCKKTDQRLTILKRENRNAEFYLFEASPDYSLTPLWKSKLSVNVRSIRHQTINNANTLYDSSALALLISMYLIAANRF
ncbi:hypothetical protein [Endozoicomonas sp. 8E]|uniref:hypothetical protein n=1 Tax=Endozoicomonas sp. 8E TaxID=3035692 RepID=UPI002939482A|nr:hypothetical protein [Endozoicomonas sp. 8E]WOG29043.1 hypothetical protein P6910_05100 [Endozoicomonas sp. 8E]